MKQHGLAESPKWTRAEDYVEALARRRTARHASRPRERTQPEAPRLLLSTVPFLVLLALLGLISVAVIITALPGSHARQRPQQTTARKQGVAARGWLQQAQKEFHR